MLDRLATYAGTWQGTNTLQDPTTGQAEVSPSLATVTPVLDGRFIRFDYTWEYQQQAQAGSLLIGYEVNAGVFTGQWIDTWHMGDKVMTCRSRVPSDVTFCPCWARLKRPPARTGAGVQIWFWLTLRRSS